MKKILMLLLMVVGVVTSADAMYHQLRYRGTVAGNTVEVALNYNTGDMGTNCEPYWTDDGRCRYVKYGYNLLTLVPKSACSSKTWVFDEYNSKGERTGRWVLKVSQGRLTGTFKAAHSGKTYKVNLRQIPGFDFWRWGQS